MFPADPPATDVAQFGAAGFSEPVCGFLHTRERPAVNGMPLGGIAMTCMYAGERRAGLEILRGGLEGLVVEHRYSWTPPNVLRGDTGERTYGTDYYQNLVLWALPAALGGQDPAGPCRPGDLVDRVLRAAAA